MRMCVYFKAKMKYENLNHFLMTRTTDGEKKVSYLQYRIKPLGDL